VPLSYLTEVLALVEPDGGFKMGKGLARHPICPAGAEKVCFRHFRQSGQLPLLPIYLLLQVVHPVLLFSQPDCQYLFRKSRTGLPWPSSYFRHHCK
jgi:hypothetical protein